MKDQHLIRRLTLLAALAWSLLLGASWLWNIHNAEEQAMEMAYAEARTNLNKDITFRRWGTLHGGVYVPVTETQKPVSWLAHMPDRDVTTTTGRSLTLINPASMVRQMMDLYSSEYGIRGRITGLKYLNPDNAPDDWERQQLESFTRGEKKEAWEVVGSDGKPQLRYLRAVVMEPGCDKCHGILGFKTGDVRGAIGLSLPLAAYQERLRVTQEKLAISHSLIWLVGLVVILWSGYLAKGWMGEREQARLELLRHRDELEYEVEARTLDLSMAKEAAEAANRAKSAFLANMSHEIRTPLNAITGMAYRIRKLGVTPQQTDYLGKIDAAGQHLLETINSILDLSKIEAGKFSLDSQEISIRALVANVAGMLEERCRTKGLKMLIDVRAVPPMLIGDPVRLQQSLLNYAGNAVKFTGQGTITLRVTVEHEDNLAVLLRFEVEDTGPGISDASLGRLFSAFEQGDNSITREHGGTGLGLAITKKLAELMGGSAGAHSQPGIGSTFWFTARLGKAGHYASPRPAQPEAYPEEALRARHAGKRVLLVEDEPINQEIARELIKDAGLAVEVAGDGLAAVECVSHEPYDLILMDMQMPHLDGLEATRQIRRLPNGAHVPIVAMTANAFSDDRVRCIEAGMDDFISKPFDPDGLFSTILAWLDTFHRHDETVH